MELKQAALNSVLQVYPNTKLKGCFYHFPSNMWKHIQNLGLQNHYQNDKNFALWLCMLSALALVIHYFELLIDEIFNNFNDLIDYIEDNYIGICCIKFIE